MQLEHGIIGALIIAAVCLVGKCIQDRIREAKKSILNNAMTAERLMAGRISSLEQTMKEEMRKLHDEAADQRAQASTANAVHIARHISSVSQIQHEISKLNQKLDSKKDG